MPTEAREQRTVWFSGQVQGVGFRYTTHRVARGHEVAGSVRNLPDGRVELVAVGRSEELDRFLEDLRSHFGGMIHHEQSETAPATNTPDSFVILH